MRMKRTVAAIFLFACIAVICALASSLSHGGRGGDGAPAEQERIGHGLSDLAPGMSYDRPERDVYDTASTYKFDERVSTLLSEAEFTELDSLLYRMQTSFVDDDTGEEQYAESMDEQISNLRSDLALIKAIGEAGADSTLLRQFKSPDVLAAAVVYSPASLKLDAFLNQDAAVLPGIPQGDRHLTALHEVDMDESQRVGLLNELNTRRSAGNGFNDVRVFIFHAFLRECQLVLVRQQSLLYSPYTMTIAGDGVIFTVRELKEQRENALLAGQTFDADNLMAMRSVSSASDSTEQPGRQVVIQIPDDFEVPPDGTPWD